MPTFFLSKELAVHGIVSRIQFSIPQPLLELFFLILSEETSVYFMNLQFWKVTGFSGCQAHLFGTASIYVF